MWGNTSDSSGGGSGGCAIDLFGPAVQVTVPGASALLLTVIAPIAQWSVSTRRRPNSKMSSTTGIEPRRTGLFERGHRYRRRGQSRIHFSPSPQAGPSRAHGKQIFAAALRSASAFAVRGATGQ